MPASTWARTWEGYWAAYWPSLNMVARSPFWRRTLSRLPVLASGPSSKVSPTYPLQVAAFAGVAAPTTNAVSAAAVETAAAVAMRRWRRFMVRAFLLEQGRIRQPGGAPGLTDVDGASIERPSRRCQSFRNSP